MNSATISMLMSFDYELSSLIQLQEEFTVSEWIEGPKLRSKISSYSRILLMSKGSNDVS